MATRTPNPKATGWVLGTVLLAVALSAGAYFLAIGPVMAQTDEARQQTVAVQDSNDLLAIKIGRLKGQFEHLDEYKAELAAIRTQVPTDAQLAAYLREVKTLAEATGVTVTTFDAAVGHAYVPPVTVAPAAPAAEETAPTDGAAEAPADDATAEPATPPAAAAAEVPQGFVVIPVGVTAVGTYDNVVAFMNQLQSGSQRLYLVTGFTATAQEAAEASGGRPATVPGDLEVAITGFTYALQDPATAAPVTDPAAEPAPAPVLPAPVPGKNPVVPVGS